MLRFARRPKGLTAVLVTMVAFGVFAVAALADAPETTQTTNYSNLGFAPNQTSVVGIVYNALGDGGLGTTTLTVEGGWAWPTHGSDCNTDRAGAGYAMDWYDPNDAGYAIGNTGISVGSQNPSSFAANTDGNVVQPTPSANDPSNPSAVQTVSTPADYASWGGGCGKVSTGTVTGWQGGGNAPTSFSQGFWGPISHTYVGAPSDLPSKVCTITYDVHPGKSAASQTDGLGTPGSAGEITAGGNGGNGDNSMQDNAKSPAGNVCTAIIIPQLQIVKTADAAQVNAGESIGFTLTVSNPGSGDATGVTLADPLPTKAGLSWQIASQGTGWASTCAINAGSLNCGPETVPAGTTEAASTFTVHITSPTTAATGGRCPAGSGVVNNTGTVNSTNAGSGHSSASTCVKIGTHTPPPGCTGLLVKPKALNVGQSTKIHLKITNGLKGVAGIRVRIKGAGLSLITGKSNAKGKITTKIKPKRSGIVTFRTVSTTSSCKLSKRLGAVKAANISLTG